MRPDVTHLEKYAFVGRSIEAISKIWRKHLRKIWTIFNFTLKSLSSCSICIENLIPWSLQFWESWGKKRYLCATL